MAAGTEASRAAATGATEESDANAAAGAEETRDNPGPIIAFGMGPAIALSAEDSVGGTDSGAIIIEETRAAATGGTEESRTA